MRTKPTLIPTAPNTWAVEYPEERTYPKHVKQLIKPPARKARKRFAVEDQFGFRGSRKKYGTIKAATQAAAHHSFGRDWTFHAVTWRE